MPLNENRNIKKYEEAIKDKLEIFLQEDDQMVDGKAFMKALKNIASNFNYFKSYFVYKGTEEL